MDIVLTFLQILLILAVHIIGLLLVELVVGLPVILFFWPWTMSDFKKWRHRAESGES